MSNDHIRWSKKEFSAEFIRRMFLNNCNDSDNQFLSQTPKHLFSQYKTEYFHYYFPN